MVSLGGSNYFMHLHEEWHPPALTELPGQLAAAMAAVVVLGTLLLRRLPSVSDTILMVLFAVAGARAVRCLPYFGMVAVFPVAIILREVITRYGAVDGPLHATFLQKRGVYGGAITVGVCLVVALGNVWVGGRWMPDALVRGPSSELFPYEEGAYAATLPLAGDRNYPVVAPPAWGGFLTLASKGSLYPLLDDRNTLVGEELYEEYARSFRPLGEWRAFTRRYGGCIVIAPVSMDLGRQCRVKGNGCSVVAAGRVAQVIDVCRDAV
jgi:hypothetical protein